MLRRVGKSFITSGPEDPMDAKSFNKRSYMGVPMGLGWLLMSCSDFVVVVFPFS